MARFYQSLLGGSIAATNDRLTALTPDEGPRVDFQRVDGSRAPAWPDPDRPAQTHLDIIVDDLNEGERLATALGARSHFAAVGAVGPAEDRASRWAGLVHRLGRAVHR